MVKNYMEDIVELLLPSVIEEYKDICSCSECVSDVKAITLNHLKPCYIATEKGHVYTKVNELLVQFRADIVSEAVKAMDIVSKNPRHSLEESK